LQREPSIVIDKTTWPRSPGLPVFPNTFQAGYSPATIDIPAMLLQIGYLTTPSSARGASLSEFWAWIRYLAALMDTEDLRLNKGFAELDAHQKTILSDDFGMGLPMLWLSERLDLQKICDGRYFIARFMARARAMVHRTAKRGPNKSPDFVARDSTGVWHVIECKGTQSGPEYLAQQLGEVGPPPSEGVAQKRSITFPKNHTGQRLVCGLGIAIEGGLFDSTLKIIDPEPEKPFKISGGEMILAEDALSDR
jgi:hypothetical protein